MTTDDSGPDTRAHIEVLRETIDRNRDRGWEGYRTAFSFEVIDDGRIRVSMTGEPEATSPVAAETDHVVAVEMGRAVDCDCHVAQRPVGQASCRHMRAVDAHPRL